MWEMLQATDNFSTKVGQGAFGEVYRAHLENNMVGGVKRATKRGNPKCTNLQRGIFHAALAQSS